MTNDNLKWICSYSTIMNRSDRKLTRKEVLKSSVILSTLESSRIRIKVLLPNAGCESESCFDARQKETSAEVEEEMWGGEAATGGKKEQTWHDEGNEHKQPHPHSSARAASTACWKSSKTLVVVVVVCWSWCQWSFIMIMITFILIMIIMFILMSLESIKSWAFIRIQCHSSLRFLLSSHQPKQQSIQESCIKTRISLLLPIIHSPHYHYERHHWNSSGERKIIILWWSYVAFIHFGYCDHCFYFLLSTVVTVIHDAIHISESS